MADLVNDLRACSHFGTPSINGRDRASLLLEAAGEIERLRGFIERQFPGFDSEDAMMLFDKKERQGE